MDDFFLNCKICHFEQYFLIPVCPDITNALTSTCLWREPSSTLLLDLTDMWESFRETEPWMSDVSIVINEDKKRARVKL